MTKNNADLEINGMETTSSLPAKPDELADILPVLAEVQNQKTGEFEKVMISAQEIREYICPTATLPELYIFMSVCRHHGIDPISEAYFVKFKDQPGFTVMKYTVYLKRAMQSGVIKSLRHEFDDEENPTKIMVYIERTDMEGEWCWTTYRSEVEKKRKSDGQVTEIWRTQLRFMMTKCGYSQALRFFCADVVGALPPTQEEMGGGIPALNMPMPQETAPALETETPSLEVESVEQLPEHEDLSALRSTYFGMIKGLFPDDAARKKWQLEKLGVESVTDFVIATYAKAWREISKMAGPQMTAEAEEKEGVESEVEADQEKIDADTRKAVLKNYTELIPGILSDEEVHGDWREKNLGQRDLDKLTTLQLLEGIDLFNKFAQDDRDAKAEAIEEEGKAKQPETENGTKKQKRELRERYTAKVKGRFASPAEQELWQVENIGQGDIDKWTINDLAKALGLFHEADQEGNDPLAKQYEDLKNEYLRRVADYSHLIEDLDVWQSTVSGKSGGVEVWGIGHFQMALKALDQIDAEKPPVKDTDPESVPADQGEGSTQPEGDNAKPETDDFVFTVGMVINIAETGDTPVSEATVADVDDKSVLLVGEKTGRQEFVLDIARALIKEGRWIPVDNMSDNQFKELKKLIAQLPRYNKSMGSTAFRDKASEIVGRRVRGVKTHTAAESDLLIETFGKEVDEYNTVKDKTKEELDFSN